MQENVKYDAGVTGDYMRLMEDEDVLLERGIVQGRQGGLVNFLESKFPISEEIREKICAQEELKILDEWLQYAAKATDLEEFMAMME